MAKVRYKIFTDQIYEVYGAREREYTIHDYDGHYEQYDTELLIYSNGRWYWVDAKDYEPIG
jgi:hypothetical protein